MPKSILEWKTRRSLLESRRKTPPAELSRTGRELVEAGRPAEAWEFFRRAEDKVALDELRLAAVDEGDFFVYTLASGSLGIDTDGPALERLAVNARERGLLLYEGKALAALGRAPQDAEPPESLPADEASPESLPAGGASPESPSAGADGPGDGASGEPSGEEGLSD
jgi:hypothetical protein